MDKAGRRSGYCTGPCGLRQTLGRSSVEWNDAE